jgi:HEAT repeat protein
VAETAARGLAAMPEVPRARADLLAAYGSAGPTGRRAIADALETTGVALREAVEREARVQWERNVAALSGDAAARPGAAEELGASARGEAVQRLLPLVDPNRTRDAALAAGAARGLGEAGDWTARPHLEALLADGGAPLAETAAGALARLGDPAAADALAAAAASGPSRIARAAVDALAALPSAPDVGTALCTVALRSSDPEVAARAARSVAARDAECPERALVARLGRAGTEAALAALAELSLEPAVARGAAERIAPLLEPARGDAGVRIAAAHFLGRARVAGTAPAVLRRTAAVAERIAAARDVPATPPRAQPAAVAGRAEPDRDSAELAALLAAAGRLRAEGAEALLLPAAHDALAPVRAGAVEGLAALATPAAVAAVEGALADPDLRVRLVAADAVGRQGARGAAALARAAQGSSREPEWLAAVASALGEAGSPDAVAPLAALLDGPAAPAAAAALARLATPAAAPPLVGVLERGDGPARAEAIDALAQLGAREAGPAIAAQLTHDRPEVRAAAARALGLLRYEGASSRLEALRSDYYGRVRRVAVEALAKLPAGASRAGP